jgi:hypothetical protein
MGIPTVASALPGGHGGARIIDKHRKRADQCHLAPSEIRNLQRESDHAVVSGLDGLGIPTFDYPADSFSDRFGQFINGHVYADGGSGGMTGSATMLPAPIKCSIFLRVSFTINGSLAFIGGRR